MGEQRQAECPRPIRVVLHPRVADRTRPHEIVGVGKRALLAALHPLVQAGGDAEAIVGLTVRRQVLPDLADRALSQVLPPPLRGVPNLGFLPPADLLQLALARLERGPSL
jgi:hypothetical protein